MNENKINPLLDVISEIDDNIITGINIKKSKKRPLMIAVAAAAAAALAVITGAAVVNSRYSLVYNGEQIMDINTKVFKDINLEPRDQLIEMGATYERTSNDNDIYNLTARPSEVFEVLNAPLLLNDNFTDEATDILFILNKYGDPLKPNNLFGRYSLTDKNTNVTVDLNFTIRLSEESGLGMEYNNFGDAFRPDLLDLNDGSKALVLMLPPANGEPLLPDECYSWSGSFCYGGISYSYHISKTEVDPEIGEHLVLVDRDTFMQTLDRLGIL